MDFNLSKEQQLIIIGLIVSLVIGLLINAYQQFSSAKKEVVVENSAIETKKEILVHISGAVKKEGVYKLKEGDRLLEAVIFAGGSLQDADLSQINLAEKVKDGSKFYIPAIIKETNPLPGNSPLSNDKRGDKNSSIKQININTANEAEIDSLPGIGASFAKKIIEYRRTKGRITKIEQLLEIPRFGKSRLEKIKSRTSL